jgi:hypothetical protein
MEEVINKTVKITVATPELDKMRAVSEQSQAIGEFLDMSEYVLAQWVDCTSEFHEELGDQGSYYTCWEAHHLVEVHQSIEEILADYFEIDLKKVESERREIIAALRSSS